MSGFMKISLPAGSDTETAGKWIAFSVLESFFNAPASFEISPEKGTSFAGELQEYDDLFKGTAADIFIPLWASACLHETGCLLDQTTLRVVQAYHCYGYTPVAMDGNPPDYIGQQFRFLCYLIACSSHEKGCICLEGSWKEAWDHFVSEFTLDTVRVVAEGVRAHTKTPLFPEKVG